MSTVSGIDLLERGISTQDQNQGSSVNIGETDTKEDRERRVRTLTEKGTEQFETNQQKFSEKLIKYRRSIQDLATDFATSDIDKTTCAAKKNQLNELYFAYKNETQTFYDFLERANTDTSMQARESQEIIFRTVTETVKGTLREMELVIEQQYSQSVKSSKSSSSRSTASSELARQRAKAEAAKARLSFERQQLDLKKEKANIELKRSELEAHMEFIDKEKEVAAAVAEYEAYRDELEGDVGIKISAPLKHDPKVGVTLKNIPNVSKRVQTNQFVNKHSDMVELCDPDANETQLKKTMLDPNTLSFVPVQQTSSAHDIAKFLMKKDLLAQRLTKFDDRPEIFATWKNRFRSIVDELCLDASEELDLLVRWLGPESGKYAVSLRSSNANNPAKGLERLWQRLYERYGCPEMIEHALKAKLDKFPRLNTRDNSKLFELSDILSEIESCMEDPQYNLMLSYFNSSSGVSPIVSKLPVYLQGKWTHRATRYKKIHNVTFPPFTEFCLFIREMSSMYNDPSFNYTSEPRNSHTVNKNNARSGASVGTAGSRPVNVRKTDVKQNTVEVNCPIHKSQHSLNQCRAFRNKTMADRKRFLREYNICYRCCETDAHIFKNCLALVMCNTCGSDRHPTALHSDERQVGNPGASSRRHVPPKNQGREGPEQQNNFLQEDQAKETVATKCTNVCGPEFTGRSCAKIVLVKVYPDGEEEKANTMYAILDDQSNCTLCRPEFFDRMNVSTERFEEYTLVSCAGTYQTYGRHAEGFTVSAIDNRLSFSLPDMLECNEIPTTRSEIPTPEIRKYYRHLQDITIPELDPEADILLLIGRDLPEAHHVLDQRTGPRNSPFAQKLGLGWVVVGDVCTGRAHKPDRVNVLKTRVLEDGRPTIFPQCNYKFDVKYPNSDPRNLDADVFSLTKDDNKPGLSTEDKDFLKIMDAEFKMDENSHWSAPLPFRNPRPRLPNNKSQALKRARALDIGLRKDAVKRQHFEEFMEHVLQNGHAEEAPPLKNNEECWYLPVFGVYHPKKRDQIRAVFDSSAKFEGLSLNGVLLSGPDLTNNLVGVLMRFRQNAVGITGDIQQMFYQFYVHEKDRNFLRFLWYRDNDLNKELIEYRMRVHVFGNSPSPAVATYGLRKIAQLTANSQGADVKNFIDRDFYVDDGLTSLPSTDEAVSLMKRTQEALSTEGNLRLHKIASNDKNVLISFPEDDLDKNLKTLDLAQDTLPVQRSLGLSWDLEKDCFEFKVTDQKKPFTKRGVLSTVNSLYDPLGFLAPVTIGGKLLLREITTEVQDWDEPIPRSMEDKWQAWLQSLQDLTVVSIPRTYVPSEAASPTRKELHVFSDASEQAIAAVAFLRTTDGNGQQHISFVHGKSKVAPKHGHTIPRLELCAAVLAVEVAELVSEELSLSSHSTRFYTDSKVVLGYLQNKTRRFYVYVENRVSRILQFTSSDKWSYIATDKNPADQGTRYVAPINLQECSWLNGQSLKGICEENEDNQTFPLVSPGEDGEIRPQVQACKTVVQAETVLGTERFARFSDWGRLVKAVSLLTHLAKACNNKQKDNISCQGWHVCQNYKTVEAHDQARDFITKQFQQESFNKDIKCLAEGKPVPRDSRILALSPFLDEDGILRVGGRLQKTDLPVAEKHPVLIPGQSHLATLLVRHYHHSVRHQGRHFTEGAVRAAGYWVIGAKRLINFLIHKCVKCQRLRGRVGQQKMSDLPVDRVTPAPPFSFVGVDVFGPWNVGTRVTRGGAASAKRWAVLFVCQTTRAIHIELIEEMSSSSFINALRRFFAIRGKVQEIRSDRGTNFVGATDDLKIDAINVEDTPVKHLLYNSGTVWRFNPPHSSHMGGSWERMIGVSRRVLDSVLMDSRNLKLSHEVLSTLLAEVMAIVNSRPLVPVSSDAEDPLILTPSMLLTQKTNCAVESFEHIDIKDAYRSQWKQVQFLADLFWRRWRREYIHTLQLRPKWQAEQPNLQKGDVVLMPDKTVARNMWPLGIVTRVFPSEDDLVRKAEIRVALNGKSANYVRPITDLVKILSVE